MFARVGPQRLQGSDFLTDLRHFGRRSLHGSPHLVDIGGYRVNGGDEPRQVAAKRFEFLVTTHIVPIKHGSKSLRQETNKRDRSSYEREHASDCS
jgi:hypothetical protein